VFDFARLHGAAPVKVFTPVVEVTTGKGKAGVECHDEVRLLLWVPAKEFADFCICMEVVVRLPFVLAVRISPPLDKVLHTIPTSSGVKDFFHFVLQFTLDNYWCRRSRTTACREWICRCRSEFNDWEYRV
jgi:hypothetical protein